MLIANQFFFNMNFIFCLFVICMQSGKLVQTDIHSSLLTRYMDNLLFFIFDYLILTNSDHALLMLQIEIKELDDFAQAAFHGYKSLNRIQSHIYQTTYNTNENILVISVSSCSNVLLYVNFIISCLEEQMSVKDFFFPVDRFVHLLVLERLTLLWYLFFTRLFSVESVW